jgi:hypothetical protein
MNNQNNNYLLLAWLNAFFGTIFSQPVLSALAYIFSIIGSIVYIAITIDKHLKDKKQ